MEIKFWGLISYNYILLSQLYFFIPNKSLHYKKEAYNKATVIKYKMWYLWIDQRCNSPCIVNRADSRFVPNQWETPLQSNGICHWLCAYLESALVDLMSTDDLLMQVEKPRHQWACYWTMQSWIIGSSALLLLPVLLQSITRTSEDLLLIGPS